MVTEHDLEILNSQEKPALAEWWCVLNCHEWPEELPDEDLSFKIKPFKYKPGRRSQLMSWIANLLGYDYVLQVWNSRYS